MGLAFLLVIQIYHVCFGPNFHAVLEGRVYRSAQLEVNELHSAISRYGLRSIINLRGMCCDQTWYLQEVDAAEKAGLAQFDINLSTYMPPNVHELRKLVHALETAPEPMLIHCRQGADRTSLAAALALLLKSPAGLAEARGQMSWRYAHSPIGRVQILDAALDDYEAWLNSRGEAHSSERLVQWVNEVYLPGPYWAEIEALELPPFLLAGKWATALVRVTNRSRRPWQFRRAAHVGYQLKFEVRPDDGAEPWTVGVAGRFDCELKPGASLTFYLAIPPADQVGTARLTVDMEHQDWCTFNMVGSKPLEQEIEVWPWPLKPPSR
jgi:protein tyrosine phosphatase (PTP) superfamily phosphohydrolase (DUF442 family)